MGNRLFFPVAPVTAELVRGQIMLRPQVIHFLGLAKWSRLALPNRFFQGELVSAEYVDMVKHQR
jgi:hypothetical protein